MARPFPPAWYRDPSDAGQLRRWNGRAWTAEVRAVPPWLSSLPISEGPAPRRFRGAGRSVLARRLWSASAITLLFALLLALSLPAALRSVERERVDDARFLAAASAACDAANRTTLQPFRSGAADDPDRLASALDRFGGELADIETTGAADRAVVARWVARWHQLAEGGHRYAAALAAGDRDTASRLNEENLATKALINRFAYANGLTACAL